MEQLDVITGYFNGIKNISFWQNEFLGNTFDTYALAAAAFFVFLIIFKIFQKIILNKLNLLAEKTKTDIDDTFIEIIGSLRPPFYLFVSFYLALQFLTLNLMFQKILMVLLVVWVVYQAILAVQILIEYVFKKTMEKEDNPSAQGAIGIIKNLIKGILWIGGIMVILSNMGVDITALIAGLGIGGIAIAFAFQNILEDLFSSFAILFDKPFQVGDFIAVGDKKGTVQKIGIKTTRIKSTLGDEIIISNKELTSTQVQNFRRLEERRVVFALGVTYETSTEKLKRIPETVKNIIEKNEKARFDRAHFKSFDDSALAFEIVYYVESNDYAEYMDIQQNINFAIKEAFEKDDIGMAYPTQTIYIAKQ